MKQALISVQQADEKRWVSQRFIAANSCESIRQPCEDDEPADSKQATLLVLAVMMMLISIAAFYLLWAKLSGGWPFAQ